MCAIYLSCNKTDTLISQVTENPSGDFKSMHRHISKGAWTFSDQDHGWQVSDCTAEGLKVTNSIGYEQLNLLISLLIHNKMYIC
jgi:hypothetical protein